MRTCVYGRYASVLFSLLEVNLRALKGKWRKSVDLAPVVEKLDNTRITLSTG